MSSSPPLHTHPSRLSFSSSNTGSPTWYGYGFGSGPTGTLGGAATGSPGGSSGFGAGAGYGYGYGSGSGSAGGGGVSGSGQGFPGFGSFTGPGRRMSGSTGPGFGFGGAGGNGTGSGYKGGGSGNSNSANANSSGRDRSGGGEQGYVVAAHRHHEEKLINAYEAEEERIINVLSRKLEELREDKIDLENALEAESESAVNRLTRELARLRQVNSELEARLERNTAKPTGKGKEKEKVTDELEPHDVKEKILNDNSKSKPKSAMTMARSGSSGSNERRDGARNSSAAQDPEPSLLLDALRRENEELRSRLGRVEQDYARVKRLNEVYREELIVRRGRLGLPVDNLIGLTASDRDPFAHPTHRRRESSTSPFPQRRNIQSTSHRPSLSSSWVELDVEEVDVEARIRGAADYEEEEEEDVHVQDLDTVQNPIPGGYYTGSSTSYVPRFLGGHGGYADRNNYSTSRTSAHGRGIPIRRASSQTRIRRPNLTVAPAGGVSGEHPSMAQDGEVDGDEDDGVQLPTTPISPSVLLSSSSTSTSDSVSPYPFSPVSPLRSGIVIGSGDGGEGRGGGGGVGGDPASYVSTDVTSPESGPGLFPAGLLGGLGALPGAQGQNGVGLAGLAMSHTGIGGYGVPQRGLSYPSVPPPSLSSSLGSELDVLSRSNSRRGSTAGLGVGSRRGSNAGVGEQQQRRVIESGSLRRASTGTGPQPLPIGGRVAETGSLLRSRAGSLSVGYVPSTVDEGEGEEEIR